MKKILLALAFVPFLTGCGSSANVDACNAVIDANKAWTASLEKGGDVPAAQQATDTYRKVVSASQAKTDGDIKKLLGDMDKALDTSGVTDMSGMQEVAKKHDAIVDSFNKSCKNA